MNGKIRIILPMLAVCALTVPMVLVSSEPMPSADYCYSASGLVVPPGGDSAEDYAVTVFARSEYYTGWFRVQEGGGGVALSNERGQYRVSACTYFKVDSLAVGVVMPDTVILSPSVPVSALSVYGETDVWETDGFICDDTSTYVSSYVYEHVDSLNIPVP